jgi:histidinol-phosphate aminotransferase
MSFKLNTKAQNVIPYQIPSTANYKIKMDMGEWFFPIHPSVLSEVQSFDALAQYGVYDDEFDELITLIKSYNNLDVSQDNVMLSNGSDNAIRLILQLLATEQSSFLVPVPSYPHFENMLSTYSVKEINKPYFNYNISNLEYFNLLYSELSIKTYDVCYIVNPSMPFGCLLSHSDIEDLLIVQPNTMFIIDEAYIEFTNNLSCSYLINKYTNIIVIRTFSKFFSLASLRIGYLMTHPNIIKLLKSYYNYKDITKLAIKCAIASLKNIDFYLENQKEYFNLKYNVITKCTELIHNNPKFSDFIMNDGMYCTLICDDPAHLQKYLEQFSIAVRNKNSDIKGALRFTIVPKIDLDFVFDKLFLY